MKLGAKVLTGGKMIDGPGFYYAPTVLADAPQEAPVRKDELFGPVAALIRAGSIDEMIEIANETEFGLGAAAFTRDDAEIEQLIGGASRAGCVFINGMVKSDPRLPVWRNQERPGFGRELSRAGHPRVRQRQDGLDWGLTRGEPKAL